jgi:mannitol/fructose-specific phosphotransferase system IIA component
LKIVDEVIVDNGKCRILIDGDFVDPATDFGLASGARESTISLGQFIAIDGSTAEAFAMVFQTRIPVVVSYACQKEYSR